MPGVYEEVRSCAISPPLELVARLPVERVILIWVSLPASVLISLQPSTQVVILDKACILPCGTQNIVTPALRNICLIAVNSTLRLSRNYTVFVLTPAELQSRIDIVLNIRDVSARPDNGDVGWWHSQACSR